MESLTKNDVKVKQTLMCHECNVKEIRCETEVIEDDIILCNQCGSEAVEFIQPEVRPMSTATNFNKRKLLPEERAKNAVDEEINKLLQCFFFKKKPAE